MNRWKLCSCLGILLAILGIWAVGLREAGQGEPLSLEPPPTYSSNEPIESGSLSLDQVQVPIPLVLPPGQTLTTVLKQEFELPSNDLGQLLSTLRAHVDLSRLPSGPIGFAYCDHHADALEGVELRLEKGNLQLWRTDGDWKDDWREFRRELVVRHVAGKLDGLLERSLSGHGAHPRLAYAMADVLQWDLDFNRDLRTGDRFEVLYEEVYLDGERSNLGNILALTYKNRGQLFEAYRFRDSAGFYDAEGRPLQRMFLRSPLPFSRITSGFSQRRFHPVLKVHRPHYGVDYGAPTGTPVRVTATGTVIFAGTKGGAGKMVKVRHANGYQTSYLHLSRIAREARVGRRARQGEVIGFVGATGLATGPHLDYRVQHNGRWINPLTLKNVPSEPIPSREIPAFLAYREALRKGLRSGVWSPPAAHPLDQLRLVRDRQEDSSIAQPTR